MLRKTPKALGKIQQVEKKEEKNPSSLLNNPVLFEKKKKQLSVKHLIWCSHGIF